MYEFPLHNKAKPEKVLFISGQVKAEMGELFSSAILEIKSMATKKVKRHLLANGFNVREQT